MYSLNFFLMEYMIHYIMQPGALGPRDRRVGAALPHPHRPAGGRAGARGPGRGAP
jgi:hypothetical protein